MNQNVTDRRAVDDRNDADLINQIDIAIYVVDENGRCVRMNPAAERLLGYRETEVLGQDMHALVHHRRPDGSVYPAEECPLLHARVEAVALHGIEDTLWARDGSAIPVECSASPLDLGEGRRGAVITLKDKRALLQAEDDYRSKLATQQEAMRQIDATASIQREQAGSEVRRQRDISLSVERAAAKQLRKQGELLAAVAENSPIGNAVFDTSFKLEWSNPVYQEFLRLAGGDDTAETVHPALDVGGGLDFKAVVERTVASGQEFITQLVLTDKAGRTHYWRWLLRRFSPGRVMATAGDITAQAQARLELERVYAYAPIALASLTASDMRFTRANREAGNLLGMAPEELIGRSVNEVNILPDATKLLQRAAAGEETRNQRVTGELPGHPGDPRDWLLSLYPQTGAGGQVETISVAATEITAQRRAEEALVQADKLAAVGRLAASISHEINNPLEAVTNLLYLIDQDRSLSDESASYIKIAEGEIARVSQIASQTLRFHRAAQEAVELTPRQIVEPVLALYRGRLKNLRVRVDVDYDGDETFHFYEGDLRQILNNLIGNAIDAIGVEGTIFIRTRPAVCPRRSLRGARFTVFDDGPGMSEETSARIFDPFYTTKGSGGSGLGLWISRTLAERHGGALRVRSRKRTAKANHGFATAFSLFVPNAGGSETARVH